MWTVGDLWAWQVCFPLNKSISPDSGLKAGWLLSWQHLSPYTHKPLCFGVISYSWLGLDSHSIHAVTCNWDKPKVFHIAKVKQNHPAAWVYQTTLCLEWTRFLTAQRAIRWERREKHKSCIRAGSSFNSSLYSKQQQICWWVSINPKPHDPLGLCIDAENCRFSASFILIIIHSLPPSIPTMISLSGMPIQLNLFHQEVCNLIHSALALLLLMMFCLFSVRLFVWFSILPKHIQITQL